MSSHFNKLTPKQLEDLACLSEEVGELVTELAKAQGQLGKLQQDIGKIVRHGLYSRNPNKPLSLNNKERIEAESGDVLASITRLCAAGTLSEDAVFTRAERKIDKIKRWLHHS